VSQSLANGGSHAARQPTLPRAGATECYTKTAQMEPTLSTVEAARFTLSAFIFACLRHWSGMLSQAHFCSSLGKRVESGRLSCAGAALLAPKSG